MSRRLLFRRSSSVRSSAGRSSSFIKSSYGRRLRAEQLEDRRMLAITVNTLLDFADAFDGVTSLREAIAAANTGAENEIDFSVAGDIDLLFGELEITDTLTIDGANQVTIDAQQNSRVLNFSASTGDLTLEGLTLTGGQTTGDGGGIRFNSNGTLLLTSSTVSGNTSGDDGGGIYTYFGAVTLTSSTVSGNTSADDGGGIRTINSSGAVTLTSSTVSGNTSADDGGGISTYFGDVTLTSSTVSGNTTTGSNADGGGIHTNSGDVTLTSSTVNGNEAGGAGGGVYVVDRPSNPSFTVENSIIAGNTDDGTAPDLRPDPDSTLTIDHSLIGDNTGSGLAESQTADADGNLIGSSTGGGVIDPLLGPLQDNGGPTLTHALSNTSPALNSGDPAVARSSTSFDQRGAPFARVRGERIDIGAFESNLHSSVSGDFNSNAVVDQGDLDLALLNWGAAETALPGGWVNQRPAAGTTLGVQHLNAVLFAWGNSAAPSDDTLAPPNVGGVASVAVDSQAPSELPGFIANDVLLDFNKQLGGIQLVVDLDQGGIYQNSRAFGDGTGPPTPFEISADPQAAWDTYISLGGAIPSVAGGAVDLGGEQQSTFDASSIDAAYFAPASSPVAAGTDFQLARVTLSDNASGTWQLLATTAGGNGAVTDLDLPTALDNGAVVFATGIIQGGQLLVGEAPETLTVDTVSDESDGDYSAGNFSLREAVEVANLLVGADTITFDPTVFTGGAASLVRLGGTELEITDTLTIDASTATGVTITGDANGDDTTDALNITDVVASSNAGTLGDNSRVLKFSASTGDLTLEGLTVTGGHTTGSTDHGGGIRFNSNGTLSLTSSTVSGNTTTDSGAIGGGIFTSSGDVTLTSSTVSGNTSGDDGGGIRTSSGAVTLTSSTVSGNTSGDDGGGIFTNSGAVTLTSSTVSGNTSAFDGGGILTYFGAVTLTSSTVSGNEAGRAGGGVFVDDTSANPSFTVENSIIAGNTDDGTAPDLRPDPGSTLTINHSLIGDTTGSGIDGMTGTGNLLNVDPLLGALADNGGPTQTHALLPGSPALDAGSSSETVDQRGFLRNVGVGVDIGAFEVQELPSLVVTTTDDFVDDTDGFNSLREAIGFANALLGDDTITFDPLVFTGGAASLIRLVGTELEITDTLTIDASTATGVTIDAQQNSRVLNFSASTGDLTLEGLTLTGGQTTGDGGGILFNSNGAVTLTSSTVSGNTSGDDGGGIYTYFGAVTLTSSTVNGNYSADDGGGIRTISGSGAVTLTSSTVSGNTSGDDGGGISTYFGDVTLTSSTVSGNTTTGSNADGGGIHTKSGDVTLTSSTVNGNEAGGAGGGIHTELGSASLMSSTVSGNTSGVKSGGGIYAKLGSVSVTSSTVSGNTSSGGGGAIFTDDGSVSLTSSAVTGNTSSTGGGGIFTNEGSVSLASSTVSGNTSETNGGAINSGGPLTISNSTIVSNIAQGYAGGVFPFFFQVAIENSIIAGNTDDGTAPDLSGSSFGTLTISHSLIGDTTGLDQLQLDAIANGSGNLQDVDPLLGLLAENGGPTQTHALLPGSPALDAGSSSETVDQRGFLRNVGVGVDIGAYEAQEIPSLVVTTTDDLVDETDGFTSLREAIGFANQLPTNDTITFDAALDGETVLLSGTELQITDSVAIDGSGLVNNIRIDANGDSRVLRIDDGDNSNAIEVSLNRLTLTGGDVATGSPAGDEGRGGAIFSLEDLTVTDSVITGNRAFRSGGGIQSGGGSTGANLTLTGTVLSNNEADVGSTGNGNGGGAYIRLGTANITASTFSGNTASRLGGGLFVRGDVTVSSSTFTENAAAVDGGGLFNRADGTTALNNSIVANSTMGNDLASDGTLSGSFNLIADAVAPGGLTDTVTGDPLLGPLADNGGPTPTHALLPGSPAIDAGASTLLMAGRLFNTGIGNNGSLLADSEDDPHYEIVSSPNGAIDDATVPVDGFPIPPWIGNQADSRWIGPDTDNDAVADGGNYLYRTTFNLTEEELETFTFEITGQWASDNVGSDIRLNGLSSGQTSDSFVGFTGFVLSTGFQAGPNTLEFEVNNAGFGSTGLQVNDIALTATYKTNATDQRGLPRSANGGAGDVIDIGAFEAQGIVTAAPGDYNRDNVVDTADYTVWRDALGTSVSPLTGADGDGDGEVTIVDYQVWRSHFGFEFTPPPQNIALSVAPEPMAPQAAQVGPQFLDGAFALLQESSEEETPRAILPQAGLVPLPSNNLLLALALSSAEEESDRDSTSASLSESSDQEPVQADADSGLAIALGEFE